MKIARTSLSLGAAIVLAAGLAGCSASDPSADKAKLIWWATQHTASIPDSEAAYQASIDRFTAETGIDVEVEVIPWADLYNKILAAVSSGSGPDVLSIGTTWTASLHDTGALVPATGAFLEDMGGDERFISAVLDAAHIPGEDQTAIPFLSNVYSMYYNTAIFAAAGISEPPATWEDFVTVGKQLTVDTDGDGTIDQWGFSAPAAANTSNAHMAFILGQQEGGNFVDDGKVTLTSPAQTAGVEKFVDLMATDQIMSPSDAELDVAADSVDRLISGEAAMTFVQNPIEQFSNRGFTDWAVANVPVIAGGTDVQSMVAGANITVLQDSQHQSEAFEFVGHVTSVDEQAFLASSFGVLPVVTDAYDAPAFADNPDPSLLIRRDIQANAVAPFPLVPNIGEIESGVGNAIREMMQAFATGKDVDLEGRLRTAEEQLN